MLSSVTSFSEFKRVAQVTSFPSAVKIMYYNIILLTHIYTKSHILKTQTLLKLTLKSSLFGFLFHQLHLKFKAKKHRLFLQFNGWRQMHSMWDSMSTLVYVRHILLFINLTERGEKMTQQHRFDFHLYLSWYIPSLVFPLPYPPPYAPSHYHFNVNS